MYDAPTCARSKFKKFRNVSEAGVPEVNIFDKVLPTVGRDGSRSQILRGGTFRSHSKSTLVVIPPVANSLPSKPHVQYNPA